MGTADQAIRIAAALMIIGFYYFGVLSGVAATVLLVLAGIFILTSFISFCPLYYPFNIHTNKVKPK